MPFLISRRIDSISLSIRQSKKRSVRAHHVGRSTTMAFDAETYSSPTQELVFRSVMCSTIKRAVRARALDVGVIVLPHRRCSQKGVEGRYWHLAIRVIDRSQLYDHELLGLVIARSVDEAAPRDIGAGEGRKIQFAVVFHVDGLRRRPGGASEKRGDEDGKPKL